MLADFEFQDLWSELPSSTCKGRRVASLLGIYYFPGLPVYMATFMSLPTELRLQIYRELFISKPRVSRLGRHVRGPVTFYNDRTFYTAVLEVSKQVHVEAISVLYGETAWTLHVYLIFRGNKIHGSNVDGALHSLARTKQFPYIRTCILDIRLFQGEVKETNTTFSGIEALRANVKIVRQVLSRAQGLKNIEISWRNYFNLDLTEPRCKSLEPLNQLPITYNLFIGKVESTTEGSNNDLTNWPDMLKAYRVMLFRGGYGDDGCIEWRAAKRPRG